MQFAKVDRSSVTEQIIESLKDQILKQKLKPGQQLPSEENLGNQLGVGRGTLREALRVLVYLGLIERRNKSTYVTSNIASESLMTDFTKRIHQHRDVMQMIEFRTIVEPEVAALAAERSDTEDLNEIGAQLALMEASVDNVSEFALHDQDFHLAIFQASGNHILLELMKNIQQYMHQNQILILRMSPEIEPRSLEFHRRLFASIRDGRSKEAHDIMKEHIKDIENEMHKIIKIDTKEQKPE